MQEKLEQISVLQKQLEPIESQAKPLKEKIDKLKFELLQEMQLVKSKRTEDVNGYYAIRAERKTFKIIDKSELALWMLENDINPSDYSDFDSKLVSGLAKGHLELSGEILPGTGETATEYLTLKQKK
jgi:hypothetical protein